MPADKAPSKKTAARKAAASKPQPDAEPVESESAPAAEPDPVGYRGEVPDETPNENYTLPGVVAGLPVPEDNRQP